MQGKSEPEHATTETALSRCLVDGDAATRVRDRRRRRGALGISFVIESVVLALLIVAPLMTSVAQPQLNLIFPPMPVVMGDWQSHNASRNPVSHPIHHNPAFLYQDFQPRLLGTVVNSHQDAEQNADSILAPQASTFQAPFNSPIFVRRGCPSNHHPSRRTKPTRKAP